MLQRNLFGTFALGTRININQINIFSIEGSRMQISLDADLVQQNQPVNLSLGLTLERLHERC